MRLFRVEIQYGPYEHTDTITGDDAEHAIARMWALLRRRGFLTLPMAASSAQATEIDNDTGREREAS